jgi:putative Mg2+ transporter-C (MgtC) family protein
MEAIDLTGGTLEIFRRLAVATLIGCVLGLDREMRDKPAGLRTHALVTLGAALVSVIGIELAYDGTTFTPDAASRVLQGIITGIGFVGGGVILRDTEGGTVRGLTTAASIWVAAGLGMACGVGLWRTALIALGLTLLVLLLGGPLERLLHRRLAWFYKSWEHDSRHDSK